jgi:hypothetical protein
MRLLPSSFLARSVVALVASVAALGVALVVDGDRDPGPARAQPVAQEAPPVTSGPREVLRQWDDARAAAWAAGDPAALAAAYTPGSVAGRHDVARLRAWRERGWRVEMLRTQVGGLRVVRESPRELVLLVADRVAGGVAVRPGTAPLALPRDRWDTRELVLRRVDGRWRLASVTTVRLGAAATLTR